MGGIAETPAMVLFLIMPRACRYRKFRLASTSFRNGSKGAALHERRARLVVTMFTFWAENCIMYHQEAFVVGWTAFAGASPVAITTVIPTMSIVTVGGNLPPLLH